MLTRGPEYLNRGQVPALYPKKYTGPGERLLPGGPEVDTFDTIRGVSPLLMAELIRFHLNIRVILS
ncbi:hypothetical protein AGMMS50255_2840 [Spirochaetia bacterium]|nr:hypothetical protein AGMMS50255_2840 [Spirochaetia bacterium]